MDSDGARADHVGVGVGISLCQLKDMGALRDLRFDKLARAGRSDFNFLLG